RLSIAERQGAADADACLLVSASLGRGMRAVGGGVKLACRCNSSHRICQMLPHRNPSTSAAKIAKIITNVTVIEYILRARPAAWRARCYRILSPGLACPELCFPVSDSAMKETRRLWERGPI